MTHLCRHVLLGGLFQLIWPERNLQTRNRRGGRVGATVVLSGVVVLVLVLVGVAVSAAVVLLVVLLLRLLGGGFVDLLLDRSLRRGSSVGQTTALIIGS